MIPAELSLKVFNHTLTDSFEIIGVVSRGKIAKIVTVQILKYLAVVNINNGYVNFNFRAIFFSFLSRVLSLGCHCLGDPEVLIFG